MIRAVFSSLNIIVYIMGIYIFGFVLCTACLPIISSALVTLIGSGEMMLFSI